MQLRASASSERRAGRPRKYSGPSRPVTVTLPEHTLEQLRLIHADRGRAIVKAVEMAAPTDSGAPQKIELVRIAPGQAVIVIPPSRMLRSLPWLRLAEVAPARYLLTTSPEVPLERVEIALGDLVIDARKSSPGEVALLEGLRDLVTQLRRSQRLSMAQILIVKMP